MSIDLEDELRQAYAQLPADHTDHTDAIARSHRAAGRLRRRRTVSICAGTTAAVLVLGGAVVVDSGVGTAQQKTGLVPAGAPTATASLSFSRSPSAGTPTTAGATTTKSSPILQEDTDKPLAGLSGKLLPHGEQLPGGVLYRGSFTTDYKKTWTTSLADGYENPVPLVGLIGADQSLDGPSNAQINAAYGIVSGVDDTADSSGPDTSPKYRWLDSTIVRFRNSAFAKSAIAKAQRHEGGMFWIRSNLTTPNVAWSGVPGTNGDHGVYALPIEVGPQGFLAYQVVDDYIVSAQAASAATAEQAVTDMVGNLKNAGLLK